MSESMKLVQLHPNRYNSSFEDLDFSNMTRSSSDRKSAKPASQVREASSSESVKPPRIQGKKKPKSFRRRVEFFRAYEANVTPPKHFKNSILREAIKKLNFDDDSAYLKSEQDNVRLAVWDLTPDLVRDYPIRWRLGLTTVDLVGPLEKKGRVRTPATEDDEGGHHSAHVVFFKNGIVGVEYLQAGPRHGKVVEYINKMLACPKIEFRKCLTPQGAELLEEYQVIRKLQIKLRRTRLPNLKKEFASLHSHLEAIRKQCDADEITLFLSADRDTQSDFNNRTCNLLANMAKSKVIKKIGEGVKYWGKKRNDRRISEATFKAQHLFTYVTVAYLDAEEKKLDSDSVFEAIIEAYNQNKESLESSYSYLEMNSDND